MGMFKIKTNRETYINVERFLIKNGIIIQAPTGTDWIIGKLGGVVSSYSDWDGKPPEWFYGINEVSFDEIRAMVKLHKKPIDMNKVVDGVRDEAMKLLTDNDQREYLNKLTDGTYKLVVLAGDFSGADELTEVPEGAECLTECMEQGELFRLWWKGEYKICIGYDETWFNIKRDVDDYMDDTPGVKIVWQRHTQPEELPFLSSGYNIDSDKINHDFNPSINDQYEKIEAVHQTLNERQSQYGDFKDVAKTTAALMDQFALGRMSYVQREALHMICSKLARIANGDPNHIDSWHDIAGYATLVVSDLES